MNDGFLCKAEVRFIAEKSEDGICRPRSFGAAGGIRTHVRLPAN